MEGNNSKIPDQKLMGDRGGGVGEGNAMGHKVNHFKGVPRDTREDFGGRKEKEKIHGPSQFIAKFPR